MPARWQSEIEHIQSGKMWKFNSLEELGAFLQHPPQETDGLAWVELQVTDLTGVLGDVWDI